MHGMCKQPTVVSDDGGRGQLLSTVYDDRYLLITLSVQF